MKLGVGIGCVHDPVEPVYVAVVASAARVAAAQLSTGVELEQRTGVSPSGWCCSFELLTAFLAACELIP